MSILSPKEIADKEIERQIDFGYEPSYEDMVIAGQKFERTRLADLAPDEVREAVAAEICGSCIADNCSDGSVSYRLLCAEGQSTLNNVLALMQAQVAAAVQAKLKEVEKSFI